MQISPIIIYLRFMSETYSFIFSRGAGKFFKTLAKWRVVMNFHSPNQKTTGQKYIKSYIKSQ
jgi:hypothetical protein